ncbi:MAG: hypothetical protein RIR12_661 [Bacteroidota bacterium]|jgi:hypothetical protein
MKKFRLQFKEEDVQVRIVIAGFIMGFTLLAIFFF